MSAHATVLSGKAKAFFTALWFFSAVVGLYGLYLRLSQGHLPAGYGSYVPWGLWVALYFHGVGIAGGAFFVGGLAYLAGWAGFRNNIALRLVIVLSAAAILPAFLGVYLDLGHMERAFRIFTAPSFTSMMAYNAWMYAAFTVVAAVTWGLSFLPQSGWLKPLICLGAVFSLLFPSQSGAFFGVVESRPFWHSALLPILFLTSAIVSGSSMLFLLKSWIPTGEEVAEQEESLRWLRVVVLGSACAYFGFEFAEFSIALWSPTTHSPAVELILAGPYWWVFWIVHLLLGGIVPIVLLWTKSARAWTLAAALLAVCFLSARLNVLIPGQAVGEIHGLQEAFQHPRLSYIYHATPMEYFVGFLMLALGMTVFFAGRFLGAWVDNKWGAGRRIGA
jgi:protein NrfD